MMPIIKSRFLIALFLCVEILLTNSDPIKIQVCFLITALPQIYRKFFASLWPAYAKKIRV